MSMGKGQGGSQRKRYTHDKLAVSSLAVPNENRSPVGTKWRLILKYAFFCRAKGL